MNTKIVTKTNSTHNHVFYPNPNANIKNTVTFSGGWHNISGPPVPWVRIDIYTGNDEPEIVTWLSPEHFRQAYDALCGMDDCQCGSGLQTNPYVTFDSSIRGSKLIPVSTPPDQEIFKEWALKEEDK